MLAMQYSIQLPHGSDDTIITERVDQRRELFDGLKGMVHKAYLYNKSDKVYAPFYVWEDLPRARDFLLDDLFQGVIQSFNRPRIRDWFVLEMVHGGCTTKPTFAIQEIDLIPAEENIEERLKHERKLQKKALQNRKLYCHMIALDPNRWEIIRYHLWADEASAERPSADCVQTYDVLHVSEQDRDH